jgi:hypothetical protein
MAAAAPPAEDFEDTEPSDFDAFTRMTGGPSTDTPAANFDSDPSWWDVPGAFPGHSSTQLTSDNFPAVFTTPMFTSTDTSVPSTGGASSSTTGGAPFSTTGGTSALTSTSMTDHSTHRMDTDPPSSSTNTNKRTYSTMSFGNEYRSASTAPTLSDPGSVKRHQNSQGSHTGSKGSKTSARLSSKLSPATAVVGMQGSINRLTDILEKSMAPPPLPPPPPRSFEELSSQRRTDAMQRLQVTDDHLSLTQKVGMVSLFNKDIKIVDTYLSLSNDDLRQHWMLTILKENNIDEEV